MQCSLKHYGLIVLRALISLDWVSGGCICILDYNISSGGTRTLSFEIVLDQDMVWYFTLFIKKDDDIY